MKPGDLVAWSEQAIAGSGGPSAGDYAGVVVRVRTPNPHAWIGPRAKVELLDDQGTFIVTANMVNVLSSVNSST